MNKEECIKEFVKEAQFYEQHYARIDIRFVTDFLNKHLEIYAEAKAKEASETIEMLRQSLAQTTANRIFEKENTEKEAYNQGVRDAAESAMMKFHDGFHKENKDIDYFMSGQDNLTVSKQSILKLLK